MQHCRVYCGIYSLCVCVCVQQVATGLLDHTETAFSLNSAIIKDYASRLHSKSESFIITFFSPLLAAQEWLDADWDRQPHYNKAWHALNIDEAAIQKPVNKSALVNVVNYD